VYLTGSTFSQTRGAHTSDLFVFKVKTQTGDKVWREDKPFFYGGGFDDMAWTTLLSNAGKLITGGEKNGQAWLVCFDTEGGKLGEKTSLKIEKSGFGEPSATGILRKDIRGYYEIWVQNTGQAVAQNVHASISTTDINPSLRFSKISGLGNLAVGEKRRLTIPLSTDGKLAATTRFVVNISADNLSEVVPEHRFEVKTEKALYSNLVLENIAFLVDNQQVISRRTPQTLTFEVVNTGDKAAKEVKAMVQFPSGVKLESPPSVKPNLDIGERAIITVRFSLANSYAPTILPVSVLVFEDKIFVTDKQVSVKVKDFEDDNQKAEPAAVVQNEIILSWLAPDPIEQKELFVEGDTFKLKIRAISTQPLKESDFQVFINGQKAVSGAKGDKIKLKGARNQNHEYTFVQEIELTEGVNKLEVVAQNAAGTKRSSVAEVTRRTLKPNLHLLTIGVVHNDLKYPQQDATDITTVFEGQSGKIFGEIYTTILNQKDNTTATKMRRAFLDIQNQFLQNGKIKPQDVVVIFMSSHGKVMGKDAQFRIAASDFDDLYPTETTLDFKQNIMDVLAQVNCKKLLLLDACESGGVQLTWQGAKTMTNTATIDEALTQLAAAKAGTRCITSSKIGELSYEDEKWRNGAFTEALIEAFKNVETPIDGQKLSADSDKNSILTITELYNFVSLRVPNLVKIAKNKTQNPQLINCNPEDSFPVFKY
jgi:hypothetical protein